MTVTVFIVARCSTIEAFFMISIFGKIYIVYRVTEYDIQCILES